MENEAAIEARAADRLILFSDAVVAIAITLLALELPVPAGRDVSAFWKSVRENDAHYLAFLLSFVAISASWGGHHRIFRAVERIDTPLRMINMFWLMMIILNPLATKMLTTEDHDSLGSHALRYGFYALLQTLAAVALLVIARRLAARHLLVGGDRPMSAGKGEELYGIILGFGLSIPVFFFTMYGWALWIAGPVLAKRVYRPLRERRRGSRDA
ncbi:TMEM175 family protein [Streptomyces sp. NBC_01477]|uniref:TMEM175 family protein n=1 Tax=Streptomyces sp. NBC_01477 TaxID=2976015 RepID=UPI002E301984|nr:TMEM175 family protein [Streptomyces sp. NBC_01477]